VPIGTLRAIDSSARPCSSGRPSAGAACGGNLRAAPGSPPGPGLTSTKDSAISRTSLLRISLLAILWGSGFLFVKLALRGLSPIQVVLAQLGFGAIVLLLALAVRHRSLPRAPRTWLYLAGMAVLANLAPYLLFSWSEQRISAGLAGVLSGTTPLLTLFLAYAFGVGRLTVARVLGLVLGLVGVVLLAAPWHDGPRAVSAAGILAALGAAACYAASYVYARRLLTNRDTEPLVLAAAQLAIGACLLGVTMPWLGRQQVTLSATVVLSGGARGAEYRHRLRAELPADPRRGPHGGVDD
jgi:drug/metabolite transporter (DMT)-like permease